MIYDIVIIGGASAGLTAGIYASRKKLKTLLLTKQIGGQSLLTDTIENFPGFDSISGKELIGKMRKQAERFGVEIEEGVKVEKIEKKGEEFEVRLRGFEVGLRARAIIIATGKSLCRLNIPGEKEFENKGVSFCSICDTPLFGGKDVAVIGGGNSGMESAMDLTKYANKIYILECGEKIKGDEFLQEKLKRTGKVEFINNAEVKEIKGSKFVEKIIYEDKKTSEIKEIPIGGVFVNIGWIPATGFLKGFVELNSQGEIIVNHKTQETSVPGVFAAGDVTDGLYKQCITAAGDAAKAALSAYDYLVKS